jgi:hypothetical protein
LIFSKTLRVMGLRVWLLTVLVGIFIGTAALGRNGENIVLGPENRLARDSVAFNWNDLDLTGSYFKKHTTFRMPAWPFIGLGAAGVGVAGYYLFQGTADRPPIEARDDLVYAGCLSSVAFNVLVNDVGEGLVVRELTGVPQGITVEIGSGGLLQIDNVGNQPFAFRYGIQDVHGQRRDAEVKVEVQVSALVVRNDEAEVPAGGSVAFNVLNNDTGASLRVISHSMPATGTLTLSEDGNALFQAANEENCVTVEFSYTVEDGCGQQAEGQVTVRTLDGEAPVIVCPPRYDLACGEEADPEVTGRPEVTDNCDAEPEVSYADSPAAANCPVSSAILRVWTARDASGNETTCEQTIRYLDSEPPVITCPADRTLPCGSSLLPAATGTATATDDCTGASEIKITYKDNLAGLNQCGGTGVLVRTWTAEDACGKTATCTQRITLTDNTAPVITCPGDITIGCDKGVDPSVTGMATAFDLCSPAGDVELTYIDQITGSINCQGSGQVRRTWVATDACGNTSTCIQNIQVTAIAGPTITCPPDKTISCSDSRNPNSTGRPTGSTSCSLPGELVYTYTDNTTGLVGCNGTGILVRTWRVTDPCGLSATCTQILTIQDVTPPVVNCPANVSVSCNTSTAPSVTGTATATDNCTAVAGLTITYTDNTAGLTGCNGTGVLIRTWKATDACGNTGTCDQRITVQDVTPPVVVCPPAKTIKCTESTLPVNTGTATATDNCTAQGAIVITYTDVVTGKIDCSGNGTITRTWRATDACGNTGTCVQTISVEAAVGPDITCPPDVTISCSDSRLPAVTGTPTATATCTEPGEMKFTYTDNTTGLTGCNGTGLLIRTWTAEDPCGLKSSCEQRITIRDITAPVITCPANVTISCTASRLPASTGNPTVSDNCTAVSGITISYTDNITGLTGCGGTGVLVRTWRAVDACGNQSTCAQRITIQDVTPPAITCPPTYVTTCDKDYSPATAGLATAIDNCGGAVTITHADVVVSGPGNCTGVTTIARTWTARDACNNTSTCVQSITVNPTAGPSITCPGNITISCSASRNPSNTGTATATTACSLPGEIEITYSDVENLTGCSGTGTITRTWRAKDPCGGVSTCAQTITIQDNQGPTLSGVPTNATVSCDAVPPVATVTASDNCDAGPITVNFSESISAGACPDAYTIVRSWSATDACGNTTTRTQTIAVQDNTPPQISCPANVSLNCTDDRTPASTGVPTVSDNCSDVGGITVSHIDDVSGLEGCAGQILRTWTATDACGNSATCVQTISISESGGRITMTDPDAPSGIENEEPDATRTAVFSIGLNAVEFRVNPALAWRISLTGIPFFRSGRVQADDGLLYTGWGASLQALHYLATGRLEPYVGAGFEWQNHVLISNPGIAENPWRAAGSHFGALQLSAGGNYLITNYLIINLEGSLGRDVPASGWQGRPAIRTAIRSGIYFRF